MPPYYQKDKEAFIHIAIYFPLYFYIHPYSSWDVLFLPGFPGKSYLLSKIQFKYPFHYSAFLQN